MTGREAGLGELPVVLEHESRMVLAIPVGMSRNEFALAKLAGVRNKPGWIVRENTVSEWRLEGFFTHGGRLYLHGPYLPGSFMERELPPVQVSAAPGEPTPAGGPTLPGQAPPAGLRALQRLIDALLVLQAEGHAVPELQTDAVYLLEDGGLLFLPPELMRELGHLRPEAYRLLTYQGLNHPELRGSPDQVSFSIAALLHRLLRGGYPFFADTEEDLRNRLRHEKLAPLSRTLPGLRGEISQAIHQGLRRAEGPAPSLARWAQLLREAAAGGFYRQLAPAERRTIEQQARKEQGRAARAYRLRVFWQRQWKTVLIVVAAAGLVGGLGGAFLKNLLAPRLTRGFTPAQVVEAFYGGMNSLDHSLMEDCVVDRAGKEVIREVINVYVLSRVSLGYEGKSHILSAEQWLAQGRPELAASESLYGITGLQVRQERGEPEPVFRVAYTKWSPTPGRLEEQEPSPDTPRFESQDIRERVYLRLHRRDWVIYRIQRL